MSIEGFGATPAQLTPGVPVALQGQGAPQAPPPAVTWVAPHDGATVNGSTVGLLVTVTSTIAVTGVDFFDASNANALIGHGVLGSYGWLVTWDSTGVADGARSLSATATDGLGQTTTHTISVTVRNGVAPPAVSWIAPAAGQTVEGSVGFLVSVTSSITVSTVEYFVDTVSIGTATHGSFGWLVTWDSTGVADGVHEVAVHATDANAQVTTATLGFTVDNIPPAPGPPTVAMLTPATATNVTGATVSLVAAATASSPATITNVTFYVDNVSIGTGTSGSAGYTRTWDSTAIANGSHTIKATVTDSTAQTASDSVTVTVNNASQLAVVLNAPQPASTVSGTGVVLFATATDNSPNTVSGVNFYRNNTLLGAGAQSGGGWLYAWDSTSVADASYTIKATATDSTAATASASANVTVHNTPPAPTVTFAAPAKNATISATVTVDAFPSSSIAISSVRFFLDGTFLGNGTAGAFGYTYAWDTTTATNATHLLKAVATDVLSQTGTQTISVTVSNVTPPTGTVMPVQGGGQSVRIDNTDTLECSSGINAWIAAHTSPGDTILVQPGTYWIDGTINLLASRTMKAQHANNRPVFHRHTLFPYRITPDLRSAQPTYNPNGTSSQWQYDALGGQASVPTSLGNPNRTGTASGEDKGGYDAKTVRSADGTHVVGIRALYGAPWTAGMVGYQLQVLIESGFNGVYNNTIASVASDGKSVTFVTPVAGSASTKEGGEGTVCWNVLDRGGAGWKVEHQTNDLLSYYVLRFKTALAQLIDSQMAPIVQFGDTSPVVLDGIVVQHCNDAFNTAVVNFEKSDPVITEFMRAIEDHSPNQIIRNCELHHTWGAGEWGPAQLLDTSVHHTAMQACTAHWTNKLIDGDTQNTGTPAVWQYTHHSIIDIENPSKSAVSNVTIQNLIVGGPQALVSYSSPVKGFTIRNVSSTNAQVSGGTINSTTGMWASSGALGYSGFGQNHLITGCHFDETHDTSQPAMTIGGCDGLTVTNNTIPTTNFFLDRLSLSITGVHTAPSPTTSGTTFTVGTGTEKPLNAAIFGIVFPLYAMIWPGSGPATTANAELVQITGIAGDTLTVLRAQRGSTARTVLVGDRIAPVSVNVTSTGNVASGTRGQVSPDVPFS